MGIRPKSSSRRNVEDLRLTIDCLPIATREAMLDGVRASQRIIVGAYTDRHGGVCPMLAAHRRGGRTNFLSFARAWDRFTHAGRHARAATRRERRILIGQLEASLMRSAGVDLEQAIGEHRGAVRRRQRDQRDPGGEIVAKRARRRSRRPYSESPGRMNMISGTTHAGEVLSR
ncbi:MAG TPA: hypothetical protein VN672_01350 [Solirubrobacteraceae bacterium]|nr:hypothetical protein [Solirubrobacteraceae bacterium]